MAQLTGQLQTETRGKSIVDGNRAAPSFLGGLLDVAQGVVQGLGPMQQRADAKKSRDAQNAAEQATFDWLKAKNEEAAVDPTIKSAGDELQKAKTAEEQGRSPTGAYSVRAEKVVEDLYNQFPDQKAEIARYLQGRGFDHWRFRELQTAEKWRDLEETQEMTAVQTYYKAAVENGVADPNDFDASVKTGAKLLEQQAKLAITQKNLELALKQDQLDLDKAKFAREQAEQDTVSSVMSIATVKTGAILPSITSVIQAAGTDEDRLKQIQKIKPQITYTIETYRANARAQLAAIQAGPKAYESLDKQLDDLADDINKVFDANFESNKKAIDTMKVQFAIDDAAAMPLYGRLSRLMGQAAVNQLFSGDPASSLPPEIVEAVKEEVKGYKTQRAEQAAVTLNNVAQMLKGQKGLGDMTEVEARAAFKFIPGAVKGNEAAIIKGDFSVADSYRNALSVSLNAATEIQPGSPDINAIYNATETVASAKSYQALNALMANAATKDETESVMLAARGTAAHLLRVAQQSGPDKMGSWSIVWDAKNGSYHAVQDKKAAAQAGTLSQPGVFGPGGLEANRRPTATIVDTRPPSALTKKVLAMNNSLNFLIATRGHADNLPAGATNRQLREFYARGKTPTGAGGAKLEDSASQKWDKALSDLNTELEAFTMQNIRETTQTVRDIPSSFKVAAGEVGQKVSAAAEAYGIPQAIAHRLVRQESGGNQAAISKAGAIGVMQLMPGTAKDLGVNPNNLDENIDGGMKYLAQMYKRFGNWRLALAAYNAGPGAVERYGDVPPFEETQNYVKSILGG